MADDSLQRLSLDLDQIEGSQVRLTKAQGRYLYQVLRLQPGDLFLSLQPGGGLWRTQLGSNHQALLLDPCPPPPALPLCPSLAIALPKAGLDDLVRPCVELGVKQIVPVISARTVLKPSLTKQVRWQRLAAEAAEQCEQHHVPPVLEPMTWEEVLHLRQPEDLAYVGVTRRSCPSFLAELLGLGVPHQGSRSLWFATGPEGGWTEGELALALEMGYQPVSLGRSILRTVTAPLAALSLVMAINTMPAVQTTPD